jgi:leucyl-tRNA synthetase
MGWDSFGLPAEQYAIETGTHPEVTTKRNIETFKRQLKALGFSYDWGREVATTDEGYVRWTQWVFCKLFEKGLARQEEASVNWCPKLGTVLANEEVIGGTSERGGHPVVRTPLRQWVLEITKYADRLVDGLDGLDWPKGTMESQRQWIGRSEGCTIKFGTDGGEDVEVFTTRCDTIMGVTYVCLAPENKLVPVLTTDAQRAAVDEYVAASAGRSDMDRAAGKDKTGVFTGSYATHPLTGEKVEVWAADYVLGGYGTGAVMAVPAHDERDYEFAEAFRLPVKNVVGPEGGGDAELPYLERGVCVNSGKFTGMKTSDALTAVAHTLEGKGRGGTKVQYKLRDWLFSRQR